MGFEVKIDVFEGPFDLLLQLILNRELDICDVPIARITDDYIRHVESINEVDLNLATEFLVIAATLLLFKARVLLSYGEEVEFEERAPQGMEELAEKLIEYKCFQNAAFWLERRYEKFGWSFGSKKEIAEEYSHLYPDPFEGVSAMELAEAFVDLLALNTAGCFDTGFIAPIRVSVSEHMDRVRSVIRVKKRTTFTELASGLSSKLEIIATFLAVLELFRSAEIDLRQSELFGEIELTATGSDRREIA